MSSPKCFLRRREVILLLMDLGFARKIVQKWLREGILPPHEFPGLPKRANQRAYWSLSSVEQRLGVTLRVNSTQRLEDSKGNNQS